MDLTSDPRTFALVLLRQAPALEFIPIQGVPELR